MKRLLWIALLAAPLQAQTTDGARGTDLPPGNAAPPPVAHDRSADAMFGADAMAAAEAALLSGHGGGSYHQILFNLAEVQPGPGHALYRWEADAWFGGDINRLVLKSEGEGGFGDRVDHAEVQALYARALGPYWTLQAGLRHDFARAARSYAAIGIEGLAPYQLHLFAAGFISDQGDALARLEALYDQRITPQLILQPRVELNLAAQDVPESRIGAGLANVELGLRLRYEIRREFAPYVGVSFDGKLGQTAAYARQDAEATSTTRVVAGVRFWF